MFLRVDLAPSMLACNAASFALSIDDSTLNESKISVFLEIILFCLTSCLERSIPTFLNFFPLYMFAIFIRSGSLISPATFLFICILPNTTPVFSGFPVSGFTCPPDCISNIGSPLSTSTGLSPYVIPIPVLPSLSESLCDCPLNNTVSPDPGI